MHHVLLSASRGCRLDDLSMVDDDNLFSILDRAQAVGDDDDGLATIERVEVLHDDPLVVGIKGVRCLVKEDVVWILVHRTGDEDTLPLSQAQSHAVMVYLRFVLPNEMLTLMEICNNSHRRMKSMAVRLKVSIS